MHHFKDLLFLEKKPYRRSVILLKTLLSLTIGLNIQLKITCVTSKETAAKFYFSEEYQAVKAVRDDCADTDLMIIEGAE